MTCIVGFIGDDGIYMGGDSAGVSGFDIRGRADEKVFIKDDMIYGFTSSFRMGQILRFRFNRPEHKEGIDDYEYLCSVYIDELIKCFKEHGYLREDKGEVSGGIFLIGYKGNLYKVEGDFQVGKSFDNYDACGCGEYYALGALSQLDSLYSNDKMLPTDKVIRSLRSAERFSAGVRRPFVIEYLKKEIKNEGKK